VLAVSMAPAGDASKPLVVDLSTIALGERLTMHRYNAVYFILHRTPEQVAAARAGDSAAMPSRELDSARVKHPEWLIVEARPDRGNFYPPHLRQRYYGDCGGWYAAGGEQYCDLSGCLHKAYRGARNLPVPNSISLPIVFLSLNNNIKRR
jgi:ubiquinol-cytochrome c reductase iron-sulfur subunit